MNEIEDRIIEVMIKADKPLILNHISQRCKVSPQATQYQINKLVECGTVLCQEEDGTKYYFLQPPFYLDEAGDALLIELTRFADAFSKSLIVPKEKDRESITICAMQKFIKNILKNSKTFLQK